MDRSILIVILLLNLVKPSMTEPTCSKFHYEEQTLEKMIRQEIKVEKMKEDIEKTEKRVINALEELKSERIEFNKDLTKKEDDIKSLRETLETELGRMNTVINGNIDDYTEKIQTITASVIPPVIAFKADIVTDESLNTIKVLVFSNVIFNIGGAYSNSDGIFTAPVTGLYLFSAQLCISNNGFVVIGIVVNDKTVSATGIGDSSWWKCYTFDAVTVVEKGNDVSIKCINSCDKSDKLHRHSYAKSSFSGALIHKT